MVPAGARDFAVARGALKDSDRSGKEIRGRLALPSFLLWVRQRAGLCVKGGAPEFCTQKSWGCAGQLAHSNLDALQRCERSEFVLAEKELRTYNPSSRIVKVNRDPLFGLQEREWLVRLE